MSDAGGSAAELERLSLPRPLPGVEHYPGNELYGHARLLKAYAGLDPAVPLPALVPHGITFNETFVSEGDRRAGYPAVLSYPAYRDNVYRERCGLCVEPSAAPFLYGVRMVRPGREGRAGTIFFPGKSIAGVEAVQDWDGLAERLVEMEPDIGPVRVCAYWTDVAAGRHLPFVRRGLEVVGAGHAHDQAFHARLIGLLAAHEYASSNSIGSHVFYALAAGCRFFFLGEQAVTVGDARAMAASVARPAGDPAREVARLRELACAPGHGHDEEVAAIGARFLRSDALRSPAELRERLAWCARLDRFGGALVRGSAPAGAMPRYWARAARHRARALKADVRSLRGA